MSDINISSEKNKGTQGWVLRENICLDGVAGERFRSTLLGEEYTHFVHTSGLEVFSFPKESMMTTALLVVRYGAQDVSFLTPPAKKFCRVPDGVAHFLEHKMFENPDGTDANEQFSLLGADVNAWTDYDRTAYLFNTAANAREALRCLLTFVAQPHFTQVSVTRERGIIGEEIGMGEDDPWEKLRKQTMQAMYARHPIRRNICGTVASIGRITEKTLYSCYEKFYRPENMFLVVCGALQPEEVLNTVNEVYRTVTFPLAEKDAVIRKTYPEKTTVVKKRVTSHAAIAKPLFQIGWKDTSIPRDPWERLKKEIAIGVLSEILFSRAGNFYSDLFERQVITPVYYYGYSITEDVANHIISGETDHPEVVLEAYFQTLEKARRDGIPMADFERCRRVTYAGQVAQFDFADDIADAMVDARSDGIGLFDTLEAIRQLTREDVEKVLREGFGEQSTVLSVLLPKK